MVDEFLNQDEIDALLSGAPKGDGPTLLTPEDLSALAEVAGILAGAASNVIGMLAGRDVSAAMTEQAEIPQGDAVGRVEGNRIFAYSMVLNGLDGAPTLLLTGERGALALADLMMGGDAKELPAEANDLYLSAAQEGLSQLVGSALTSLSGLMGGAMLTADAATSNLEDRATWVPYPEEGGDAPVWLAKISLDVSEVEPFDLFAVLPARNAAELAAKVRAGTAPEIAPAPPAAAPTPPPAAPPQAAPAQQAAMPPAQAFELPPRPQGPPVDVKPVEFAQLGGADSTGSPSNIDLIVDIPVRITVELGRTRKTIGEVLALGPGSVVELNKMAGEPVDVLVNGKLIARGEVVVIDESFGIRVTEVVSRAERIRSMGV